MSESRHGNRVFSLRSSLSGLSFPGFTPLPLQAAADDRYPDIRKLLSNPILLARFYKENPFLFTYRLDTLDDGGMNLEYAIFRTPYEKARYPFSKPVVKKL